MIPEDNVQAPDGKLLPGAGKEEAPASTGMIPLAKGIIPAGKAVRRAGQDVRPVAAGACTLFTGAD